MKKIYSLTVALMLAAVPAMAQSTLSLRGHQAPKTSTTQLKEAVSVVRGVDAQTTSKVATRAASMDIGYCGAQYTAYGIKSSESGVGIMFPASYLENYVGNTITAINVAAPVNTALSSNGNFINTLTKCKVYITNTLNGAPVNETEGKLGTEGFEYNTITLDTPYLIEKGKDVYICIEYTGVTSNDLIMIVDGNDPASPNAGYLYSKFGYVNDNSQIVLQPDMEWKEFAELIGANFCITATVEGDNLPQNMAYIFADQRAVNIQPGNPFIYLAGIYNEGADAIKNVEVAMKIGDQPVQTYTANVSNIDGSNTPVTFHKQGIAQLQFTCDKEGNDIIYSAYITKVNGVENSMANKTLNGYILCVENGYPRNTVVEELTSTTCSACPIGITGMEQMKEKYGKDGRFIPIAVHCPIPSSGDPMNICNQGDVYYQYMIDIQKAGNQLSAPSSYFNRDLGYNVYPSPDSLEEEYSIWKDMVAMAEVKAAIIPVDDSNVKLSVEVTPALDDDIHEYGISYTIVEDNVGPYVQTNGYAGYGGYAYGWEKKPASVAMKFNDVARKGSIYRPAENSTMKNLVAGVPVTYETQVSLSGVQHIENYGIVAMLINKNRGVIENAYIAKPGETGVSSVSADNKAIAYGMEGAINMLTTGNIYTIDGRAAAVNANGVVELPAGLYIVATSNGNAKVIVR